MRLIIISLLQLAALLILSDCGGTYTVLVPPITVNVVGSFDMTPITAAFNAWCSQQLGPDATQSQISTCTQTQVANFIQSLETALNASKK